MGNIESFQLDTGVESRPDGGFQWWAVADVNGETIMDDYGHTETYQEAFSECGRALDVNNDKLVAAASGDENE